MRITGRSLRPSNLAERRVMLSLGFPTIRVPRHANPFIVARRVSRLAKGQYGIRKSSWRHIKQAVARSQQQRRIGLKQRKRNFRALWITRMTAACRGRGLRYSQFIAQLIKANIRLNRKMLSELALGDPAAFDAVVAAAAAAG